MKLHKLISRIVVGTALLGATFGGAFAGINASASSNGFTDKADMNYKVKHNDNKQRQSHIKTNVPDGFLTLDSVPNLQFGSDSDSSNNNYSSAQSNSPTNSNAKLNLNNGNDDGNGILRVTDYRNVDKSNNTNSEDHGWNLSANVSNFQNDNSKTTTNESWTINLNNSTDDYSYSDPFGTGLGSKLSGSNFNSTAPLNDNGQYQNIINSEGNDGNNNNSGYGVNVLNYNNNGNANIEIPNVPQGSYSSTITWQLSTNVGGYDNNWK